MTESSRGNRHRARRLTIVEMGQKLQHLQVAGTGKIDRPWHL